MTNMKYIYYLFINLYFGYFSIQFHRMIILYLFEKIILFKLLFLTITLIILNSNIFKNKINKVMLIFFYLVKKNHILVLFMRNIVLLNKYIN